jgi:hypothetical protein
MTDYQGGIDSLYISFAFHREISSELPLDDFRSGVRRLGPE